MTKTKGMEEHGLLQMTIWMIQPPPCSSIPLQMCEQGVRGLSSCHVDHYHFNGRVHLTSAWRRSLAEETASSSNAGR